MRPVLSIHVPRLPFSLPQHNRRCNSPATTPCTHARVCLAHIDHYVCQLNQHKARRQRRRDVRALLLLRCSLSCRSGYSLHRFSGSPTSLTVPQAVCWQLVRRLLSCFGLSLSPLPPACQQRQRPHCNSFAAAAVVDTVATVWVGQMLVRESQTYKSFVVEGVASESKWGHGRGG